MRKHDRLFRANVFRRRGEQSRRIGMVNVTAHEGKAARQIAVLSVCDHLQIPTDGVYAIVMRLRDASDEDIWNRLVAFPRRRRRRVAA